MRRLETGGRYAQVLRYDAHFRPCARAIWAHVAQAALAPSASTASTASSASLDPAGWTRSAS